MRTFICLLILGLMHAYTDVTGFTLTNLVFTALVLMATVQDVSEIHKNLK